MSRPGAPLTQQRSEWVALGSDPALEVIAAAGGHNVEAFRRNVHDGWLVALRSQDPPDDGWHLSVSHQRATERRAPRYPTWDELAHARYELLPLEIDVVMHLPPPSEYVALHDTTFHLHESKPPPPR